MLSIKTLLSLITLGIVAKSATIPSLDDNEVKNKQCEDTLSLIEKCILLVDEKNNGRHACEIYESEECKQLYENIEEELNYCQYKDDMVSVDYVKNFVKDTELYCVKDENGEYCPLASIITGKDLGIYEVEKNLTDTEFFAHIYSLNCASELCREATINYIEVNRDNLKEAYSNSNDYDKDIVDNLNNLDYLMSTLETEECKNGKVLASIKKNYVTSNADESESSDLENQESPKLETPENSESEEETNNSTKITVTVTTTQVIIPTNIQATTVTPLSQTTTTVPITTSVAPFVQTPTIQITSEAPITSINDISNTTANDKQEQSELEEQDNQKLENPEDSEPEEKPSKATTIITINTTKTQATIPSNTPIASSTKTQKRRKCIVKSL